MVEPVGFRVRLRVRLSKALNAPEITRTVSIAGREVTVESQKRNQPLSEAIWIVLLASGFSSEEEAWSFGERLRAITEVAGLCARLGVDVGQDQPTSWMNEEFARSTGLIQPHERIFPNVHGLAVVPDDNNNRFPLIEAEGIVRAAPEHFLGAMAEVAAGLPISFNSAGDGVRILNLALINPQPLAQIALALSTVEALGQGETWTERQIALLNDLATQVQGGTDSDDAEQLEVGEALRRGVHRIGLRQGVMRVLQRLGLDRLRKEWDRIYAARSGIFHGTLTLTESEIAQLALDAMTLCARIILTAAEQRGMSLPSITSVHFPTDANNAGSRAQ